MLTTNKTLQTKSTVCQVNNEKTECLQKFLNTPSSPIFDPTTGRRIYASNPSLLQPYLLLRSKL
jgi:hypothetical protein